MNKNKVILKKETQNTQIPKRRIYIIFSIISGLIIFWTLLYNFTTIFHDTPTIPIPPMHAESYKNIINYWHNWSWFSYFTNLSNVLFFVVTTVRIFYRKNIWSDRLQIACASYMFVVGVVYWTAIAPVGWGSAIKSGHTSLFAPNYFFIKFILNNLLIHFVTVVLAITLAIIGVTKQKHKLFPNIYKVIIFPVVYYIFAWIVYLFTAFAGKDGSAYIYQFLDFFHPYGIKNVFMSITLDVFVFIGILFLFLSSYYIIIKLVSRTVISNPKTTIKNNTIKNHKNSTTTRRTTYYIIQKSIKRKGWELIKTGGLKATFVAKTKLEVMNYYKILKTKKNVTLIKKNKHGKVQSVKKSKK